MCTYVGMCKLIVALFVAGEGGGNSVGGSGGVCSAAACSLSRQLDGCMDGWHTH